MIIYIDIYMCVYGAVCARVCGWSDVRQIEDIISGYVFVYGVMIVCMQCMMYMYVCVLFDAEICKMEVGRVMKNGGECQ